MMMSRCQKTLATLGMLLFFVLGGFAVSFAHDSPSTGPVRTNELRRALKRGPAQVDSYTLRVGMASESGVLPNSSQPFLQEFKLTYSHRFDPFSSPILTRPHLVRVPIQILDSALLL